MERLGANVRSLLHIDAPAVLDVVAEEEERAAEDRGVRHAETKMDLQHAHGRILFEEELLAGDGAEGPGRVGSALVQTRCCDELELLPDEVRIFRDHP